jgi:hypothetical protein
MRTIDLTKRDNKGAALTWPEMDGNWREIERQVKGLALPKHSSLTSDDIGKLVILKNGQVKLPEFSPFVIGAQQNVSVSFTGVFAAYQRPTLTITFTDNLIENDFVELTLRTFMGNTPLSQAFVAVEADDSPTEFIIGNTKEQTMANFKTKLQAWMTANNIHPLYQFDDTVADNVCRIVANVWNPERETNFWDTTGSSNLYIVINRTGDVLANRLGSALAGALLLGGLKYKYDDNEIFMNDLLQAVEYMVDNSVTVHTDVLYRNFTEDLVRFPLTVNQLMEGIGFVAKNGPYNFLGIVDYVRSGSNLTLIFNALCSDFEIDQPGALPGVYSDYFSALTVTDGESETIQLCNYPVIGQLAGVHEDHAIVSQDRLGQFVLKGTDPILFDGQPPLLSFSRICLLDENNPGYVKITDNNTNFFKSLNGYVLALSEAQPNESFIGTLQIDTTLIMILINLFSIE